MYSSPARLRNDSPLLRLLAQLLLRTQCSSSLNCLVICGAGEHLYEAKAIGEDHRGSLDAGVTTGSFWSESMFSISFDTALLLIFDWVTPLQEKAESILISVSRKCCILFSHLLLPRWCLAQSLGRAVTRLSAT